MISENTGLVKVKDLASFLPLKKAYRLLRRGLGSALAVVVLLTGTQAYALTNVSGTITAGTTWDAASGPYVINGTVTIPAGVTLTLLSGTVVKGLNVAGRLAVDGTLVANGTAELPIVFTSYKDDTYGGDTNGDGNASVPAAGDWVGIGFSSTSTNDQLSNVVVKYGGAMDNYYGAYSNYGTAANIYIATSSLTLSSSTVSDSNMSLPFGWQSPHGIIVSSASPTITGNVIERTNYGIYLSGSNASITGNTIRGNSYGINVTSSSVPTITSNTITGNTSNGISNGALPSVSAKSNYWGSSSGPNDPLDDRATGGWYNPNGTGNQVSNYVDYTPWLSYDPNSKTTISLSGYVNDTSTGLPLANAFVKLGMSGAYTNSSGHYTINDLASAGYAIQATRSGYTSYNATGINPTVTYTYNISLNPDNTICVAGTLSGVVRDATTGSAKAGVAVWLSNGTSATTDSVGGYSFASVTPGQVTLSLAVTGYVAYYQKLNACGDQTWDVSLTTNATTQGLNSQSGYSADPVNTATGNYTYQRNDLSLPGKGMTFSFARGYNSQGASDPSAVSGPLGFGWTHNYNVSLTVDGSGNVTVKWGDGKTETYTPNGTGGFTAQYGVFDTLTANDDGTYTLKKKDLTAYNFDTAYHLTSIVDRNGNAIAVTYTDGNLTQVTDTAGRNIDFTYDAGNRIITITDQIARTVQFTYDTAGNLATAQDANGNVTTYVYDASHQVTGVTDPRGNVLVSNVYDDQKRVVTSQKDAKLGVTSYTYDETNRKTSVVDQLGNTFYHYHDELLRLIREEDSLGNSAYYTYDSAGNRTEVYDKNGNVTKYTYDLSGNVLTKADALGNTSTITYDSNNNPLTRKDALNNTTTFEYDANGNLTKTTDPLTNIIVITYNASGQPLTVTDAMINTTSSAYDGEGNLVEVTDAAGNKTTYTYDGAGRRLTATDALSRTTTYTYDNNNNLLTVTDPLGNVTTYTYDANNNKVSATDPMNNATGYTYDVKDLLTTITDPLGNAITYTYDALDRKLSVKDKRNNTTTFTYNAVGNLTEATDALGNKTTFTYDANGNKITETNPLGKTVSYTYDALNRPLTVTDPLGNVTSNTSDALSRVVSTTNAKGQTTVFEYDLLGRLTKATDANGGTVVYTYDANGNRLSMKEPNGNISTYSYDALNRLVEKTEPLGGKNQYAYDAVGNRTSVKDPKGNTINYTYDSLNRLITATYPDATAATFTYNANGNRTQMIDALGTSTYQYDTLNRLTGYTDPFGKAIGYGYDANGNRSSLTYPDGKVVQYTFDALNRLLTVKDWLNSVATYTYDAAGRLANTANPNSTTVNYVYDDAGRFTGLTNAKADSTVISSYAYTLDAIGNHSQVAQDEPLLPEVTSQNIAYAYDAENRLTGAGSVAFVYDANGNMTTKGADAFSYDYNDRLAQDVISGVTTQYKYDGAGNRFEKTSGGVTARYVVDINGSLTNVIAETNGSGNITAYYVYGLGLVSKILTDGTAYYYHYDSRGSTVALTDSSQNITDVYAYDPFGKVANSSGTTSNLFRYVGRYGVMDEGNGLQYIRARYYDPQIGRFINKDPKAGNDQDGQSLNRYAYAQNNPVRFVDVSGYSRLEITEGQRVLSSSSDPNSWHRHLVETENTQDALTSSLTAIVKGGKMALKGLKFMEWMDQESYGSSVLGYGYLPYKIYSLNEEAKQAVQEKKVDPEFKTEYAVVKFLIGSGSSVSSTAIDTVDVATGGQF